MLEELSNYATIIMALAMVNIVWQLEKPVDYLKI